MPRHPLGRAQLSKPPPALLAPGFVRSSSLRCLAVLLLTLSLPVYVCSTLLTMPTEFTTVRLPPLSPCSLDSLSLPPLLHSSLLSLTNLANPSTDLRRRPTDHQSRPQRSARQAQRPKDRLSSPFPSLYAPFFLSLTEKGKQFLLLSGVNHALFGKRDAKQFCPPSLRSSSLRELMGWENRYGTTTLAQIEERVTQLGKELGVEIVCAQTDYEGEMCQLVRLHLHSLAPSENPCQQRREELIGMSGARRSITPAASAE